MTLLAASPFLDSFIQADFLGKGIYISLLALSILCWVILIQKALLTRTLKQRDAQFYQSFQKQKKNPLSLEVSKESESSLQELYVNLKKQTLELLNKNRHFTKDTKAPATLSQADIDFIDTHTAARINFEVHKLENNLWILSTITTLAPFIGLLGTVWGILVTFSDFQGGMQNQMVLGGLSLALTTTVWGLIIAIPALVGSNYFKHAIAEAEADMEAFTSEVMASLELQYRQVDIHRP